MSAIKYKTERHVTVERVNGLPPFALSRIFLTPTQAAFCLDLTTRQVERLRKARRGFPLPLETKSGDLLFPFLALKEWALQNRRTFVNPF